MGWLGKFFGGGSASAASTPTGGGSASAASTPTGGGARRTAFAGADRSAPDLASYAPSRRSADGDLLDEREILAAGSRDQANNHPFVAGGADRVVDAVVGSGLRLQSRPDAAALGITQDAADDLGRQIERAWRSHVDDPRKLCDAERRLSGGELMALAYRHRVIDGEALAVLNYRPGLGAIGTCLQMIDPDRLSTPHTRMDDERMRAGIELDDFGAPVAYHIRRAHPADHGVMMSMDAWVWDRIARETPWGRAVVIHHFRTDRSGQRRGKLALNSVIKSLVSLTRMSELELRIAVRDALLSGAITSPYDPDEVEERVRAPGPDKVQAYQDGRAAYHTASKLTLGGDVDLSLLYPGEKLELLAPGRSASNFAAFTEVFLRQVAAALGLSYEQLANDWSKVNYSSARAALVEVWRGLDARRDEFVAGFVTPWYAAVLEEALALGLITPPPGCAGFWDAPAAWLAADWLGPSRGDIDPLKAAQAREVRLMSGQATFADLAAEDGADWEVRARQRAREAKLLRQLGLPMPWEKASATPSPVAAATVAAADEKGENADEG